MSACEGTTGLAMEISSTRRSFLTSEKEGNDFCHLRMVPIAQHHDVGEEIKGDGGIHLGAHGALHVVPVAGVLWRGIEIDVFSKGILAQGVEEEAMPLVVLRRVAIEDDRHQSTEVLDRDGLSVERGREGLCVGDAERALGLYVSRCLLSSLPGDAFIIGFNHDEQVVARDHSISKVVGAMNL
ncbi:hypothetical protein GUJ93_ZPchr0015g6834 [Zizania palustris]|uniref:Uncharacterized protein n=1 Tax=Zizania palustris TaxID=103762 RepID=A0A8J5THF3_ZIZPA|nr:hypothetical protein GUJ93_ZPchr0015g6834 [Zizania palustris]